jgi:hypothetical protein
MQVIQNKVRYLSYVIASVLAMTNFIIVLNMSWAGTQDPPAVCLPVTNAEQVKLNKLYYLILFVPCYSKVKALLLSDDLSL